MGNVWTLGPHKVWFEEPDTVWLATDGVYDMKLLQEMRVLVLELKKTHPVLHHIVDARKGSGMSPDVRKLMGEHPDTLPFDSSVMYGSSFAMRTMVNMMSRAQELLGRKATIKFTMVATEEEARSWTAEQREAARAAKVS
ncbi:hypothetical protein HPC49_27055 [Pyxidicoccus fallax]|uniref:STAS/SEC14 domain-containing protein n=1 Tax=Pyxidicoccus fallax TaxID=394095 RepID=A0A848LH59_9BACT|nr:hypothetical protein [Pyxidicoccus fallax]NMO16291.1 hypothetical protein [Pyxidicoccus fallax]NPC81864.1 hypothetical protein [Pyxidicoccus fallax]